MVAQFFGDDFNQPSLMTIPPTKQWRNQAEFSVPTAANITVVTKSGNTNNLVLNGEYAKPCKERKYYSS